MPILHDRKPPCKRCRSRCLSLALSGDRPPPMPVSSAGFRTSATPPPRAAFPARPTIAPSAGDRTSTRKCWKRRATSPNSPRRSGIISTTACMRNRCRSGAKWPEMEAMADRIEGNSASTETYCSPSGRWNPTTAKSSRTTKYAQRRAVAGDARLRRQAARQVRAQQLIAALKILQSGDIAERQ